MFVRFKDHWAAQAGRAGVKADWFATWRNWVRKERPATNGVDGLQPGAAEYLRQHQGESDEAF
jgi:hypothetical protein